MKQVKIFNYYNASELQDRVNHWIAEHDKVFVAQVLQSEAPGTAGEDGEGWALTITLVYETDVPAATKS